MLQSQVRDKQHRHKILIGLLGKRCSSKSIKSNLLKLLFSHNVSDFYCQGQKISPSHYFEFIYFHLKTKDNL